MDVIELTVNGRRVVERHVAPTTTLLDYLRGSLRLTGTKEGCDEGDCGACTVAVLEPHATAGPAWRAANACLVLLPMMHGRELVTVEGLGTQRAPHAVQRALAEALGSQCGYCTPGVTMALFEAHHRHDLDAPWKLDDQLAGNLCRCTGYRPIREAAQAIAGRAAVPDAASSDRFVADGSPPSEAVADAPLRYAAGPQRFARPTHFDALFAYLAANPDARFVHGGTDLSLEITKRGAEPPCLVSLEGLAELRAIRVDRDGAGDAGVTLGAGVRLSDLEAWADGARPALARMLRYFAARGIKNRATIGGNLCTASPIGDLAPVFLAQGARAVLRSAAGARTIPLEDFFVGYRRTALAPGELLAAIVLPHAPSRGFYASSYKVSKRQELDISTVSASFWVEVATSEAPTARAPVTVARLAFGGMAATPQRAARAEAQLVGRALDVDAIEAAAAALAEDFAPIDDHRGSARYRARVAANLLRGFFLEIHGAPEPRHAHRPAATVSLPEPADAAPLRS